MRVSLAVRTESWQRLFLHPARTQASNHQVDRALPFPRLKVFHARSHPLGRTSTLNFSTTGRKQTPSDVSKIVTKFCQRRQYRCACPPGFGEFGCEIHPKGGVILGIIWYPVGILVPTGGKPIPFTGRQLSANWFGRSRTMTTNTSQ